VAEYRYFPVFCHFLQQAARLATLLSGTWRQNPPESHDNQYFVFKLDVSA